MTTTKIGSWVWRDDEKSYAEFSRLDNQEKKAHTEFLLTLDEDELSTNDIYILKGYLKWKPDIAVSKLFSIEELEIVEKQLTSTREPKLVPELLDKNEIEILLDKLFKNHNTRWQIELNYASSTQVFIESTLSYMELDATSISLINQYKSNQVVSKIKL